MVRASIGVRILCVVALMVCAGRGGRAGGVPPLLISEFRSSGPSGPTDEYIEIYNPGDSPHTVAAASGIGYGIAASDGITRCTILNGTVIPAAGHFLCVNSSGYSLATVPAGSGTTATGDASYTLDVPENAGVALFNNNIGGLSYSIDNRADAVGPESETNPLYKEGSGYPLTPLLGPRQYAWVRAMFGSCATGTCTEQSTPVYYTGLVDTNDNATNFYYADTTGAGGDGAIRRLGAPGPQNLSAPVSSIAGAGLTARRLSGCSSSDMPPNRVRAPGPLPSGIWPLGTLDLRVKWTNASSIALTRLRFRVIDLTTLPSGTADLRVLSSSSTLITVDNYPCGSPDGPELVTGTTLEQPPAQSFGGGYNSSLRVTTVTAANRFPAGSSINVRVTLAVARDGFARFCMVPETEPAVSVAPWCYIGSTRALTDLPVRGDYDGDRAAEMAMYNPAYDALTARWTIRQSFGGFTTERVVSFANPEQGGTPVPGDYDGDGRVDPAIYRRSSGTWLVSSSRANYSYRFTYPGYGGTEYEPVPGDYDGDGTTDLAVASATLHRWIFWPSSSTSGEPVEREFGTYGFTPIGGQDFDGDGLSDMVAYNANTGIWAYSSSSSDFTTTVSQFWGGVGFTAVPGDYDGDLQADYAVYQRATGTWWFLVSGRRLTAPYAPPYTTGFSANWGGPGFVPAPGDYDGDDKTDIAVYQAGATRWLALTSTTSYSPSTPLTVTFGTTDDRPISSAVLPALTREIRAGDADGDGLSDITAYNTTTGIWSTLRSSDGFMMPPIIGSRGGTGYTAVPGDYDGDGRRDLGVYEDATGQWTVLRSDSNFTTQYAFGAGGSGWVPVPGDYDADGRADMIAYNTTTGQWYGRKSLDNFVGAAPLIGFTWGGAGYTAAPGDFDGDGRLDISVYHEASGIWWIVTSSSAYASGFTRYYGGPGYRPIPADFDGDGITDFALYQPSTDLWTILKSGTGNTLGFTFHYGGSAFTPVAGDWDGDRRADIAVYNADGSWSIVLSGTGYRGSLPRTLGGPGQVPVPIYR